VIRDYSPVIVDDYVAKTMMLRVGLFAENRYDDPDLKKYLMVYMGLPGSASTLGE